MNMEGLSHDLGFGGHDSSRNNKAGGSELKTTCWQFLITIMTSLLEQM